MLIRPSYILIPIVAAALAISADDRGYGWPFIAMHFLAALLIMGAFATLGAVLFRWRR